VAFALILLNSCSKEQPAAGSSSVTGSFIVNFNEATKASFDGDGAAANVNRCKLQIWWEGKKYAEEIVSTKVVQGVVTAEFNHLILLKDQEYTFLFWADKVLDTTTVAGRAADLYYNTADLNGVTIDNTTYSGNDDARDAFVKCVKKTVSATFSEHVVLKRPFAQLNVITTDTQAFHDQVGDDIFAYMFPAKFDISFPAPTKYNVATEEVSDDKTFTVVDLPVYGVLSTTEGKQTLTMDYILAPKEDYDVVDVTWSAKNPVSPITYTFTNVPLRRNYRTNIIGKLLTREGNWTVLVDPEWDLPENNVNVE